MEAKSGEILENLQSKVTQLESDNLDKLAPEAKAELSPEEKAERKKVIEQVKNAKAKLKELWTLFQHLEKMVGNRQARKQFRRDFIKDGAVMGTVVMNTIKFYEDWGKAQEMADVEAAEQAAVEAVENNA